MKNAKAAADTVAVFPGNASDPYLGSVRMHSHSRRESCHLRPIKEPKEPRIGVNQALKAILVIAKDEMGRAAHLGDRLPVRRGGRELGLERGILAECSRGGLVVAAEEKRVVLVADVDVRAGPDVAQPCELGRLP